MILRYIPLRKNNGESSSFLIAVRHDIAAMHFHKSTHQGKTDTSTGLMSVYLIKAFKNGLYISGRNIAARIEYRQTEMVVFRFEAYHNLSILLRVLHRIGKKIEVDTFHFPGIRQHAIVYSGSRFKAESDMLLKQSHTKRIIPPFEALQQVERFKMQFHASVLDLAEIENLIDEAQKYMYILLHQLQQLM